MVACVALSNGWFYFTLTSNESTTVVAHTGGTASRGRRTEQDFGIRVTRYECRALLTTGRIVPGIWRRGNV